MASALKRYKRSGVIRQLSRGLYDYPRQDAALGTLTPSADDIARVLAGRDAARLQPSGAYAANLLGLSDQVPMRAVFLTDGPPRSVAVGRQHITLKRTTPRNMAAASRVSGTVIQALRWLGRRHIDDKTVKRLWSRLSADDRRQVLKDLHYAPAWITTLIRRIAQAET